MQQRECDASANPADRRPQLHAREGGLGILKVGKCEGVAQCQCGRVERAVEDERGVKGQECIEARQ